jgi:predicted TIM-barrel fold metal-dependent hydrolase
MTFPFKLVSADSHIVEPPDLWLKRIERRYRDRAPRLVVEDDADYYVCEGALSEKASIGLLATQRKYAEPDARDFNQKGRWADVPRSAYDPAHRVKELDAEGIEAELLYCSRGLLMYAIPDLDFRAACFRAFNDWLADFCRAAPRRLFGVAMVPTDSVPRAVEEVERCAKLGLRGAMISIASESGHHYPDAIYDPLWSVLAEAGMPVSLHVAASNTYFANTGNQLVDFSCAFTPTMYTVVEMIFSGLFDAHPKLKVVSVENDAAWPLAILERMDDRFEHDQGWAGGYNRITSGRPPSQIFRDHVGCTFMRDRTAIASRALIGRENIMWGSDYPHFDGCWPNAAALLAAQFDDVPPEEQMLIGRANTIKFYGLPI